MLIHSLPWIVCLFALLVGGFESTTNPYVPLFEDAPEIYTYKVNGSVLLPCKIKNQNQNVAEYRVLFHWKKKNTDDEDSVVVWKWARYTIKENKGLRIRHLRKSDAGIFYCNAENRAGGLRTVARQLVVIGNSTEPPRQKVPKLPAVTGYKPVLFLFNTELKVTQNSSYVKKYFYLRSRGKLKCAVTGKPLPVVNWYRNNSLIAPNARYETRRKKLALIISNVLYQDNGNYTCVAKNVHGTVKMIFNVAIKESMSTTIVSPLVKTKYVTQGENVTLECDVPAEGVDLIHWHSSKRNLFEARRQYDIGNLVGSKQSDSWELKNNMRMKRISFTNVTRALHEGTYKCLVLFRSDKKPTTVKIVHIVVSDGGTTVAKEGNVLPEDRNTLLLMIGVPVLAGFLSMFVILTCIRRHRQKVKQGQGKLLTLDHLFDKKSFPDDEILSLKLPVEPTGSLRIHHNISKTGVKYPESCQKSYTEEHSKSDSSQSSLQSGISVKTPCVKNYKTQCDKELVTCCDKDAETPCDEKFKTPCDKDFIASYDKDFKTPCNNVLKYSGRKVSEMSTQSNISKISSQPAVNTSINDSSPNSSRKFLKWPGEKLSPRDTDCVSYSERDILLTKPRCKLKSNTDLDRTKMKYNNRAKISKDNLDNDSNLPISLEKEDLLLQREIKNWEFLIKGRSVYTSKSSKL